MNGETKELQPNDTLEGVEAVTVLSSWPSKSAAAIERLQQAQESPSKQPGLHLKPSS